MVRHTREEVEGYDGWCASARSLWGQTPRLKAFIFEMNPPGLCLVFFFFGRPYKWPTYIVEWLLNCGWCFVIEHVCTIIWYRPMAFALCLKRSSLRSVAFDMIFFWASVKLRSCPKAPNWGLEDVQKGWSCPFGSKLQAVNRQGATQGQFLWFLDVSWHPQGSGNSFGVRFIDVHWYLQRQRC